jgi:Holliday junction resolvase RusA-like endonuclease
MQMILFKAGYKNISLVSTNRKFQTHPKYINTKEHVTALFKMDKKERTYLGPVKVVLQIFTNKDIDNCDKLLHDALQNAGIIEDDKQMVIKETYLVHPKEARGVKESFIITVSTLSGKDERLLSETEVFIHELVEKERW